MRSTHVYVVTTLLLLCVGACTPQQQVAPERDEPTSKAVVSADINRIQSHLTFLADDLLEGRDTGSRGHQIASLYLATEFKKYGLRPAGDDGSYFQSVPLSQAFLEQASPQLQIASTQGEINFSYPKDYIAYASNAHSSALLEGEMIFAGYGIVAPELNHDDYANIDVKDKVVVVLSGKPVSFPSEEGAHFGSTAQKKKHAVANGAIGYISISTPLAEKVRPYQSHLNSIHAPKLNYLDDSGQPVDSFPELLNTAYLSEDAARELFANAQQTLDQIYQQLEQDITPAGFAIPGTIRLASRSDIKQITSPNVAAVLPGSDPTLTDHYVLYSAHSDHIGIAKTVLKDKINNGAMDNASGTSVLLETARMFSQLPTAPKRSILFLAVTAEERGLLGSKYFANYPTVAIENIVANVNLDMPILTYEFADVIAFGANHSDMQKSVSLAAEKVGIELSPDPWPELALFTRSDHYSFVQQGVPSVFLVPGLKSADPEVDGSKQFQTFLQTNYHKPSDDLDQEFNWRAAEKFAEVNFQIGLTLADQDNRPSWNDGDFFGQAFSKQ